MACAAARACDGGAGEDEEREGKVMEIITRAEAIARGLKRYFTGKRCKHGHIGERTVKNRHCLACERSERHRWPPDYKKRKSYLAAWYQAHREEICSKCRALYEERREEKLMLNRASRLKHGKQWNAKRRADHILLKVLKQELGLT
jgi:hypothetical protein